MFDPRKFSVAPVTSVALGNNQHPVMELVIGNALKRIPSKNPLYTGIFYVFLKDDKGVVTYNGHTIQFHNLTTSEFKALVKNGDVLDSNHEPVDLTDSKHIGTDVLQLINDTLS